MDPKRSFCDFCLVANSLEMLSKEATAGPGEGGLLGALSNLPAPALGALIGGGAGAVSGIFSDKPGSILRNGLIGAGLGAGAGWAGPKLLDMVQGFGKGQPFSQAEGDNAALDQGVLDQQMQQQQPDPAGGLNQYAKLDQPKMASRRIPGITPSSPAKKASSSDIVLSRLIRIAVPA